MRFLLPLLFATAVSADAATTMRITTRHSETPDRVQTQKVTLAGKLLRVDVPRAGEDPVWRDAMISQDGGATFIALNSEEQTWWPIKGSPFEAGLRFLQHTSDDDKVSKVKWTVTPGAGPDAPNHVGRLSYTTTITHPYRVKIMTNAVIEVWNDPATPRELWPARVPLQTNIAEVDAAMASTPALLGAFPRRIVVTATRQYEGGPPYTQTVSMEVDEIRELASVAPKLFEIPKNYREQEPVIGMPGRN